MLGINDSPVTIKAVEATIAERAFDEGWVVARPPAVRTGKRVAVVGSGPAGLAVADQLNRAGHWVTVFERADRVGGLLRYGIPEFKLEKKFLERRLAVMLEEGVMFRTNANVGSNVPLADLRNGFEAIVLAGGSTVPRDLKVPGRELGGIYFAMEFLTLQNKRCEGDAVPDDNFISAEGKDVVIIGGGETGADCLGTVHRQAHAACNSSSCCRVLRNARGHQSVAALAEHFPRLVRPRRGRSGFILNLRSLRRRRSGERQKAARRSGQWSSRTDGCR